MVWVLLILYAIVFINIVAKPNGPFRPPLFFSKIDRYNGYNFVYKIWIHYLYHTNIYKKKNSGLRLGIQLNSKKNLKECPYLQLICAKTKKYDKYHPIFTLGFYLDLITFDAMKFRPKSLAITDSTWIIKVLLSELSLCRSNFQGQRCITEFPQFIVS